MDGGSNRMVQLFYSKEALKPSMQASEQRRNDQLCPFLSQNRKRRSRPIQKQLFDNIGYVRCVYLHGTPCLRKELRWAHSSRGHVYQDTAIVRNGIFLAPPPYNPKLLPGKARTGATHANFLGRTISTAAASPGGDKVRALTHMTDPTNVKRPLLGGLQCWPHGKWFWRRRR